MGAPSPPYSHGVSVPLPFSEIVNMQIIEWFTTYKQTALQHLVGGWMLVVWILFSGGRFYFFKLKLFTFSIVCHGGSFGVCLHPLKCNVQY